MNGLGITQSSSCGHRSYVSAHYARQNELYARGIEKCMVTKSKCMETVWETKIQHVCAAERAILMELDVHDEEGSHF
jgi:hypothetical protein